MLVCSVAFTAWTQARSQPQASAQFSPAARRVPSTQNPGQRVRRRASGPVPSSLEPLSSPQSFLFPAPVVRESQLLNRTVMKN